MTQTGPGRAGGGGDGTIPLVELYRSLFDYLRPYRRQLIWAALALLGSVLTQLARPWPLKFIVDDVLVGRPAGLTALGWSRPTILAVSCAAVVVVAVVYAQLEYVHTVLAASAAQKGLLELRQRLFDHVQRLSLRYHQEHHSGDLLSRLIRDVNQLRDFLTDSALRLVGETLFVVGMIGAMAVLDWQMTLWGVASVALIVLLVYHYAGEIGSLTRTRLRREGRAASVFHETLSAIQEVQLLGAQGESPFQQNNRKGYRAEVKGLRVRGRLLRWVECVTAFALAAVLWLGANRVFEGSLSTGDLLVFVAYLRALFKPVRRIARFSMQASKARASAERVMAILRTEPEIRNAPDAVPAPDFAGRVRFRHVSFGYRPEAPTLRQVDLEVEPGETIALIGTSGAGKSTLVSLIPRLFDVSSGSVEIDGRNVRGYTLETLRRQIAVVPQAPVLFSGTVRENIEYGAAAADDGAVWGAVRLANAEDFVRALPQGLDTRIGERGARLSGGERQRLAIARTILRDAPILILDEPYAGLDAETERLVQQSLDALLRSRTAFVITHRLTTLHNADRAVVLDGGRIVEAGRPAQLLESDGYFRRLAALQLGLPAEGLSRLPALVGTP